MDGCAGHERVLVIDDFRDSADALVGLLKINGIAARACYSLEAALEAAQVLQPTIVIAEIALQGQAMGGLQAPAMLSPAPGCGQPPLMVALSGYGRLHDKARARDAGFDVFLLKPADWSEIVSTLGLQRPGTLISKPGAACSGALHAPRLTTGHVRVASSAR